MKNYLIACLLVLLAACQGKTGTGNDAVVSVTIEPQRYVAEKIAGSHFRINCVVPSGQSPETYDPSPQEMMEISRSRAYLRIGSIGFELAWMKALADQNPEMEIFDLSRGIALIPSSEEEHGHEPEAHHGHHHGATDPHIWTSARNMKQIARNALEAFVALDPEHQADYQSNYEVLLKEIEATETQLDSLLLPMKGKAFIIYHPALTYLAADYGMKQLCIEMDGKEPSPASLKALVETARQHDARLVFVQQEFDQKNAELIARETGCRLVSVNPLAYDWKGELLNIAKAFHHE